MNQGRHVRPRPNLLTRLRVMVARVLAAELPSHPDPASTASTASPEAPVTQHALAKVDPRQTQEVDMDGNGSGSGGGNSGN